MHTFLLLDFNINNNLPGGGDCSLLQTRVCHFALTAPPPSEGTHTQHARTGQRCCPTNKNMPLQIPNSSACLSLPTPRSLQTHTIAFSHVHDKRKIGSLISAETYQKLKQLTGSTRSLWMKKSNRLRTPHMRTHMLHLHLLCLKDVYFSFLFFVYVHANFWPNFNGYCHKKCTRVIFYYN